MLTTIYKWQGPLGPTLPDSCLSCNRDWESMEATQGKAASPYSGCIAAGSSNQQSEYVVFWKHNIDTEMHMSIYVDVLISFRKINHRSIQLHALILCLSLRNTRSAYQRETMCVRSIGYFFLALESFEVFFYSLWPDSSIMDTDTDEDTDKDTDKDTDVDKDTYLHGLGHQIWT